MDEQIIRNPWLPEFLGDGQQYALLIELMQYLLLLVLALALFTLACAVIDLFLLMRQESKRTQPFSHVLLKSFIQWFDRHTALTRLWQAITSLTHSSTSTVQQTRHLRFPH